MRRLLVVVSAAVAAAAAVLVLSMGSSASALTPYVVTTEADAGPGSLRAALDLADSDGDHSVITFADGVDEIVAASTLDYAPTESPSYDLTILGNGVTIRGFMNLDPVGDVTIRNLTVGSGGVGSGLTLEIYDGPATVTLDKVAVTGTDDGVFIGQDDGTQPLTVSISNSTFSDNGRDGVEVYHDKNGSVDVTVKHSTFSGNETYGLEVAQENDPGGATSEVTIIDSSFTGNGEDGALLYNYWSTLSVYVSGSHFDGNGLDGGYDGLAIDNEGGGLDLDVRTSTFDGNDERGLDLDIGDDSEGSGDSSIKIVDSQVIGNGENGLEIYFPGFAGEEFSGIFRDVDVRDNVEYGVSIATGDAAGAALLSFTGVDISRNGVGEDYAGLSLGLRSPTDVEVVSSSFIANGYEGLSVEYFENLAMSVTSSAIRGNEDVGMYVTSFAGVDLDLSVLASRFVDNAYGGLEARNIGGAMKVSLVASAFLDSPNSQGAQIRGGSGGVDVKAVASQFDGNGFHGIEVLTAGCGDLEFRSLLTQANDNAGSGILLDSCDALSGVVLGGAATGNTGPGVELNGLTGQALLLFADLSPNGGGSFTADPGISVLPIGI